MSSEVAGLSPEMPFCAAAKPVIAAKLRDLFKHEKGTRAGDDSEALHDTRVASRRLRAAMGIFGICFPPEDFKPLRKDAAALTSALGEVRDRDVFLERLGQARAMMPETERVGVDEMIATVQAEREVGRTSMIETLDAIDASGFQARMTVLLQHDYCDQLPHRRSGIRLDAPLRDGAQRLCILRVAELYGFARYVHDVDRVEELHEMRKAAKHLRYSLEILRVCFGQEIDQRIDEVKLIQEQIGEIHDRDVLADTLRGHLLVVATRTHEALARVASEPAPPEERMARLHGMLQHQGTDDPRLGLLSLLGRTLDERRTRYDEFVHWWDQHEVQGMREALYHAITTEPQDQESA
jgi:CHAD domain-containing protein